MTAGQTCLAVLIISLLCASCDNVDDIVLEDDAEFLNFEFTYQLPENENVGLKVAGFSTSGSDRQSVDDGDLIEIENTNLWGPRAVSHSANLEHISLTLFGKDGTTQTTGPRLTGINYFGIAQTRFDLTLLDQGNQFESKQVSTSLLVGYGIEYSIDDHWGTSFTAAFGYGFDLNSFSEIDLSLEYRPLEFFTVKTGYRWFSHYWTEDDDEVNNSSIEIDFDGPFLSLGVIF